MPLPVLGAGWVRLDSEAYPLALLPEVRAAARERPGGTPLFNEMIFGGFLIYFVPDGRVFIDDRCELYGDGWLAQYADALFHHPEQIEEWSKEYAFEHALVASGSGLDRYLQTAPNWALVRRTDTAAFYHRKPVPEEPPLRREPGRR